MRRGLLALLLLAALSGCASPPAAEPAPTGQIDGAVVDELLRPFADHPVYLVQLGERDLSSQRGGFSFREVPVGTYTLLTSRDGYRSATAVVDVEADRITRVILQLTPIPVPAPYFLAFPHRGEAEMASPGDACDSCSWQIPIRGRPQEVVLEASWSDDLLTEDELEFEVRDDLGMTLYHDTGVGTPQDPFTITLAGADLQDGATRLDVFVSFGPGFTTRPRFVMDEVATFYYGATREAMFFV